MERHHVAGKRNHDLTVSIPANDHAILTDAMYDWRKETRENPTGSPLLAGAACIRGFCDTVVHLIERLLLRVAELLEALHNELVHRLGEHYWQVLNIRPTAWQQ